MYMYKHYTSYYRNGGVDLFNSTSCTRGYRITDGCKKLRQGPLVVVFISVRLSM